MNFLQSLKKCSIRIPDIRKQLQTSLEYMLKDRLRFSNGWPLKRAMYIINGNFFFWGGGGIRHFFPSFFSKY